MVNNQPKYRVKIKSETNQFKRQVVNQEGMIVEEKMIVIEDDISSRKSESNNDSEKELITEVLVVEMDKESQEKNEPETGENTEMTE